MELSLHFYRKVNIWYCLNFFKPAYQVQLKLLPIQAPLLLKNRKMKLVETKVCKNTLISTGAKFLLWVLSCRITSGSLLWPLEHCLCNEPLLEQVCHGLNFEFCWDLHWFFHTLFSGFLARDIFILVEDEESIEAATGMRSAHQKWASLIISIAVVLWWWWFDECKAVNKSVHLSFLFFFQASITMMFVHCNNLWESCTPHFSLLHLYHCLGDTRYEKEAGFRTSSTEHHATGTHAYAVIRQPENLRSKIFYNAELPESESDYEFQPTKPGRGYRCDNFLQQDQCTDSDSETDYLNSQVTDEALSPVVRCELCERVRAGLLSSSSSMRCICKGIPSHVSLWWFPMIHACHWEISVTKRKSYQRR